VVVVKNLWRRKVRTLLTVAGIAIGIAVVVALLLLSEALAGQFTILMSQGGAEISLMQAGIADTSFSALDVEMGPVIAAMPEVEWVAGMLLQIVPVEERPFFVAIGLDPQGDGVRHFHVVQGKQVGAEGEIMLGRIVADLLAKGPGDEIVIQGRNFRVVGVYETGVGYENIGGVIRLSEAQDLFKKRDQVSFFQVKLRPEAIDRVDVLIAEIESQFPEATAFRSSEFGRNTPDIQSLETISGAVSLIGLLAGALGTMNTMLMSIFERTREIGTLRALGWRKQHVVVMILGETLVLSMLGGILGVGLGLGLIGLLNYTPIFSGVLMVQLEANTILIGLGVALVLGTLGGLYPAWRAAGLQPVEALRYE
jgi:ABC-type antimicrobial peptide transport system permease subunit